MRRIPLADFIREKKGQVAAAEVLGMSQGALSKALRLGRSVFITEHDDGSVTAEEVRPFPSQQGKTEAA